MNASRYNSLQRRKRALALCRTTPQTAEAIMAAGQCGRGFVSNLQRMNLIRNVGTPGQALYLATEIAFEEPVRKFEAPHCIEQASSIWHYARRIAHTAMEAA